MGRKINISSTAYCRAALEADVLPYLAVNFLHFHLCASRGTACFTQRTEDISDRNHKVRSPVQQKVTAPNISPKSNLTYGLSIAMGLVVTQTE
jgi:hypothetical protein